MQTGTVTDRTSRSCPHMGEISVSGECLCHARDGCKMLWEKPNVSGHLMFSSAFV